MHSYYFNKSVIFLRKFTGTNLYHFEPLSHVSFPVIQVELYFVEDDDFGPFSPRNELESLNSILLIINSLISCAKPDEMEVLQMLRSALVAMINSFEATDSDYMIIKNFDSDTKELMKWGGNHGMRTKLKIACKS